MAFSGVRDLSIIASPPEKRLSVKTFLRNKSDTLLEEAISRELMRGGQVYFLHNDIATIEQTANHLAQLVPQARIASCHGKTPKSQLERIMLDFYHQKINILVSTTIIESGIDVPTANTIIIDRSDKLGMAQLHQLRGRVGRSHHQAYAYLLVPEIKSLKTDAKTRLEAIAALDSLGAGFNLASQDLEIRGAGELLGEEQSGHIEAIGFTLFMDMLNQAVEALKAGKTIDVFEPKADIEIELRISALIPDRFIPDINMRLSLYQQLSECKNSTAIDQFSSQMVDRFGLLPEEVKQLIQVAKLKLQAKAMRIHKIEASRQQIKIHFDEKPKVAFEKLIDLIQKRSDSYQLLNGTTLCVKISSSEAQEKISLVEQTLEKIRLPDNK
jgi:transcription-repair coupling factor (superfamily II helicase)